MKRYILWSAMLIGLMFVASMSVQSSTLHYGGGYDTTYVLCCGKDLDGKAFCTNMMHAECDDYGGRVIYDCSECRDAPDYTLNNNRTSPNCGSGGKPLQEQ